MLEPVVVNPDIVSKRLSIYEGIKPDIVKGSAPSSDIISQESDTVIRPSFAVY